MIYFFLFILAYGIFILPIFNVICIVIFLLFVLLCKKPGLLKYKIYFCKPQEKRKEISASELRAKLEQKDGLSNDSKPCATCIVQQSMGSLTL